MAFEPTLDSVRTHTNPDWYMNAKLGIFIHWGLYSVPAWAPHGGDLAEIIANNNWHEWFRSNSYAEWYLNSLKFEDGPTFEYHQKTYGEKFSYDDFAPMFNDAIQQWNPDSWAELFNEVGARYVVLTTKHHDGFTLWNTDLPCPNKSDYYTQRDLVGELTQAVRQQGMRMGLYYSGGLDWAFNPTRIENVVDVWGTIVEEPEFVEYSVAHWKELIDKYQPSVMWNDIGYPSGADLGELFSYYYNHVPDGVINDRFTQGRGDHVPDGVVPNPKGPHYDFITPEYTSFPDIQEEKWETCRGIGHSFGYNLNEGGEQLIPADELVHLFVDIVSKNGNLLLNIGPMADGTIPENQANRLRTLGRWLKVNGEAMFDTRPWTRAEGKTSQGIDIRFTQTDSAVYATLITTPAESEIVIEGLEASDSATIQLLGQDQNLEWKQTGSDLTIQLPQNLTDSPAHSLKLTGIS